MKNLIFVASITTLAVIGCKQKLVEMTESEKAAISDISKYFGGSATLNKKIFYTLSGDRPSQNFKITLQCDDLRRYYDAPTIPASFCAWQVFSRLSEYEREGFENCAVQIPFDNQEQVFEYPLEDLLMVFEAKYFLDSMATYFINGDYKAMQFKYHTLLKEDKVLPEFQKKLEKLDADYGETKEVKFRGFEIVEMKDVPTNLNPRLVRFHVLQIRDKTEVKFSVMIDRSDINGFICGMSF